MHHVTKHRSFRTILAIAATPLTTAALAIMADRGGDAVAGAWFFQLVLEILPCPLCLEQRYAYYLAVPLGALIAWRAGKGCAARRVAGGPRVLAVAALCNAGLGAYHAGVEWRFWPGPTDCTGPIGRSRQCRQPAGPSRQGEGGALRRSAVALPRDFARRLQRADLAADGGDCGWGVAKRASLSCAVRDGVLPPRALGLLGANRPRRPGCVRTDARCRVSRW